MMADWEQMKKEYLQTKSLTLFALAQKHGVSYQDIRKQSAKEGWGKQKKAGKLLPDREIPVQRFEDIRPLSQRDKINQIADNLLNNIEQGAAVFEKPSHIATLTGALKELTGILRDVNELPNRQQRQEYELKRRKLELEQLKNTGIASENGSGGVVLLPELQGESERDKSKENKR